MPARPRKPWEPQVLAETAAEREKLRRKAMLSWIDSLLPRPDKCLVATHFFDTAEAIYGIPVAEDQPPPVIEANPTYRRQKTHTSRGRPADVAVEGAAQEARRLRALFREHKVQKGYSPVLYAILRYGFNARVDKEKILSAVQTKLDRARAKSRSPQAKTK